MLSSALLVALLVLLGALALGGLCIFALVGLGALLQKYGAEQASQSPSEAPRARGRTQRAESAPSGSEALEGPEDAKGQDESPEP